MKITKILALPLALSIGAMVAGCNVSDTNTTLSAEEIEQARVDELASLTNCAWQGPYVKEIDRTNFAYPDYGAFYWSMNGTLPEGATLKFKGEYPKARYFSFNSYNMDGSIAPYDALNDSNIVPDAGQPANPYGTGNNRNVSSTYTINFEPVFGSDPQPAKQPNTINLSLHDDAAPLVPGSFPTFGAARNGFEILYRIYVPDADANALGDVDLPQLELTMDNVTISDQDEVCAVLNADSEYNDQTYFGTGFYTYLKTGVDSEGVLGGLLPDLPFSGNPIGDNASNTALRGGENYYFESYDSETEVGVAQAAAEDVVWRTSYSIPVDMACSYLSICPAGEQTRKTGFYANVDNNYIFSFASSEHEDGPVIVSRGKLPTTLTTLHGDATFEDTDIQVRYWSFCANEFYGQRVTDCVFDEQVLIDDNRDYVIVVSKAVDRPENATEACGYNWLEFPELGDNFELSHDATADPSVTGQSITSESILIIRNMLADDSFAESIQNISAYRTEKLVMGDYLPATENMTIAAFEALPCR